MVKRPALRNYISVILLFLLLVFFFGQIVLDKIFQDDRWHSVLQCVSPSSYFQQPGSKSSDTFRISRPLPLQEAYAGKILDTSQVSELAPTGIRTEFLENRNTGGYGLSVVKNVCFLPTKGDIVLVNITEDYLNSSLAASPKLAELWSAGYNSSCGWCQKCDTKLYSEVPAGAKWIAGNTTHIIPYLGNVFHNFAERIWPHLVSHQFPLNETSMQPINHFYIHSFRKWILQAEEGNHERETFMLQFRVFSELSPGSDFVVFGSEDPVCFERLTLDCSSCDRMSNLLGDEIGSAAILSYREAAFRFFNRTREPLVSSPPRALRVLFYGRSDTRRRRVINTKEILEHLRAWTSPPLDVLFIDELLLDGRYNQTMAETVSLFSQTDILITVHGANTWGVMFMPRGAAVIEIYGPCGPGTWLQGIVRALDIKHDTETNPWKERVASPVAGNTTKCEGPVQTPDFTLDLKKLDDALIKLAMPSGPSDRFPLHWLYDWQLHRYAVI